MAGLRKRKEPSSNPNVVLIIFLVFFILVSAGLGYWVYTSHAIQKQYFAEKEAAKKDWESQKTATAYQNMVAAELRLTLGFRGQDEKGEPIDFATLSQEEQVLLNDSRAKLEKGEFKDEKTSDAVKLLMKTIHNVLGKDDKGNPRATLWKVLEESVARATTAEAQRDTAIRDKVRAEKLASEYAKNFDKTFNDVKTQIETGNAAALKAAQERSEEFTAMTKTITGLRGDYDKLKTDKDEKEADMQSTIRKLDIESKKLQDKIRQLAGEAVPGEKVAGGQPPTNPPQPLLLTCSPGKPLWDTPVGKITRVDLALRQIIIDIGSAQDAKPGITFNIFSAGPLGKGEGRMRGSIEIVKVVDVRTSVCRLTSLYDSEGQEILLNLQARGQLIRESDLPVREGDLLFNMFWGSRVAISGFFSINGEPVPASPAEQIRQMESLLDFLKNNGVQVDAYVDFRDGQVKGAITSKTRFLLAGEPLGAMEVSKPGGKKAAAEKVEVKEKEMEKLPGKGGIADRIDQINGASGFLFKQAWDRGLFMISGDNLAAVMGYRKARSMTSLERSRFEPQTPIAGRPDEGGGISMPARDAKKEE